MSDPLCTFYERLQEGHVFFNTRRELRHCHCRQSVNQASRKGLSEIDTPPKRFDKARICNITEKSMPRSRSIRHNRLNQSKKQPSSSPNRSIGYWPSLDGQWLTMEEQEMFAAQSHHFKYGSSELTIPHDVVPLLRHEAARAANLK